MNPYKDLEESSFLAAPHLSYEDIATKLLKDHYFLTALELHTELVESGKELPQLREFFSNPGNFEQHVSRAQDWGSMHRSPSQGTLDSLDTARYSEDGGGDRGGSGCDVAVLEFELRKARETINSLRANLTQFADGESALDKAPKDKNDQRSLRPHERRALNFLVNEYLLLNDYKLTSITFSDENPDQDFEDWDDVGLIMPRPSGLVSLFRGNESLKESKNEESKAKFLDAVCQTDIEESSVVNYNSNIDSEPDWSHELLIQAEEIELLKQKIVALETEKLNFQKLYDAAIVSLNSLTSPVSENKCLELQIPDDKRERMDNIQYLVEPQPITCSATENHYGSSNSTHSATPEQFELIDTDKTIGINKKGSSNTSSFDPANLPESSRGSPLRRGSVTTLDETLSINDGGEWTRVQYDYNSMETSSKEMWIDSGLPNSLKVSILNWCCETLNISEPLGNDLLAELVNSDKPITLPGLLTLVADTLPRIIPHTLVSRRCEAAALLACTIHLLAASDVTSRRAKLLQMLLTLLKKPDATETRIICEAACLIVKWGGSGEVLSSIAELLTSRSSERRILASQICVSIAPYVSIELCTSLLLSLVVLMCESNEVEVRSLGLKSACLICPVAEHKYMQLENILFNFLKDPCEKNVKDTVNIFIPVLARTALIAEKFSSDLYSRILTNFNKSSADKDWKNVLLYLEVLRILVVAKLAHVVNVQIVKDTTLDNCDMEPMNYQEVPLENEQESFLDLQCYIVNCSMDIKCLIVAMNGLLKEKPEVRWKELTWFVECVKQILEISTKLNTLNQLSVSLSYITLFNTYLENFGAYFVKNTLRPVFMEIITELEQKLEKLHAVNVDSTIVVGIYLVTVLPALDDKDELESFLQKWVLYGSIRSLPVKIISVPLKWIAKNKPSMLADYIQYLREFAASSNTSQSGAAVRAFVAGILAEVAGDAQDDCLDAQMLPAVVALLNDDDASVRETAISAWGVVTRSCAARGLRGEAHCWAALGPLLSAATPPTAKEIARAAEALALLIAPAPSSPAHLTDKAVSMLCAVCVRATETGGAGEALAALAPGLQLAAHHARSHPQLLPALRKLEEIVQSPSLSQYKATIEALIHSVAGPTTTQSETTAREAHRPQTSNLLAAQEAVGRRVTQIFQQSKTNMNLQNIFKKKT